MNFYLWTSFPFDNLFVVPGSMTPKEYVGQHTIDVDGEKTEISIEDGHKLYRFCRMDFFAGEVNVEEWWTDDQKKAVMPLLYSCCGIITLSIVYMLFLSDLKDIVKDLVFASYRPSGKLIGKDFSEIKDEFLPAYIPQVKSKGSNYPYITCDISELVESGNTRFVGWKNPDSRDYAKNTFDEVNNRKNTRKAIYSRFKYWAPPPK